MRSGRDQVNSDLRAGRGHCLHPSVITNNKKGAAACQQDGAGEVKADPPLMDECVFAVLSDPRARAPTHAGSLFDKWIQRSPFDTAEDS